MRTYGLTGFTPIMPFPMVAATAVPLKAPRQLSEAATIMAARGDSALVETEVAIALAVS